MVGEDVKAQMLHEEPSAVRSTQMDLGDGAADCNGGGQIRRCTEVAGQSSEGMHQRALGVNCPDEVRARFTHCGNSLIPEMNEKGRGAPWNGALLQRNVPGGGAGLSTEDDMGILSERVYSLQAAEPIIKTADEKAERIH